MQRLEYKNGQLIGNTQNNAQAHSRLTNAQTTQTYNSWNKILHDFQSNVKKTIQSLGSKYTSVHTVSSLS